MKSMLTFQMNGGMRVDSVSKLIAHKYYQEKHPWAKFVVISAGHVILALCEERADAEACLNALQNLKSPQTLPVSS